MQNEIHCIIINSLVIADPANTKFSYFVINSFLVTNENEKCQKIK